MSHKDVELFSRKSVHLALKIWDSPRELGCHPLANLNIVEIRRRATPREATPSGRGLSLREILRSAIEQLKPDDGEPDYSARRWRPYIILTEEFWHGRRADYLMELLQIAAKRTYQLERSKAIDRLADKLRQWEDESRNIINGPERHMPFQAPPKPPYRLVGRDHLLQELKTKLLAGDTITLYALNGLPGVGKTALAIELANDHELISHFQDGVLWAGLGREPDILSLLGTWAAALGLSWDEIVKLNTVEERAQVIHRAIGLRRMLLIIDDAWQLEAALAFRIGGPKCAHLLTTRLPDIAWDFAETGAITVQELGDDAGLRLFEQLAPKVVETDPGGVLALVQMVGGLPLAIILIAKYMRREALKGTDSLQAALARLRNAEERQQLASPQPPLESHPSLPPGAPISLQTTIEISVEALDDRARKVLQALSIFPPKPNTFPKEAILAVPIASDEALAALQHYGLLESSGPGRYTLHQAIADYTRTKLTDRVIYEPIVECFVGYIKAHSLDYGTLRLETDNVFAVLQVASEQGMPAALVRGVNAFSHFITTTGLYRQAEKWLQLAEQAARLLGDVTGLADILCTLGRISRFRGDLSWAEKHLQESLALARKIGDPEKASAILADLGWVAYDLGNYNQTEKYFQEGLVLARQVGQSERISFVLHGLGALAFNHGEHEQAEAYFKESLVLARQVEDYERIGGLLGNLGWVDTRRGNYKRAEAYFQEGLDIVREVEHRERMSFLLQALGVVEIKRGNNAKAESHLLEALALAKKIGHQDRISAVLDNLGTVAYTRGDYAQAELYFQESLVLARKIGHCERVSTILANMSAIEIGRKNYGRAEEYLREGLILASELGYRWTISKLLNWQGELYLNQQKYELAASVFIEALKIAKEINGQEMIAIALYGLARIALEQGRINEARERGQESLNIFGAIGHGRTAELTKWLSRLPKESQLS